MSDTDKAEKYAAARIERLEQFMQKVRARPLPSNPMARVRTLARELAEGALDKVWNHYIFIAKGYLQDQYGYWPDDVQTQLWHYLLERWGQNNFPYFRFLQVNGYLEKIRDTDDKHEEWLITSASYDLIQEPEATTIFISYRRKDSSAFALLILKHLKEHGLDAFVDMALVPGEDWHAGLKERIQGYDFLILVLGKETLSSKYVLDEIGWALDAGLTIIPV